MTCHNPLVRRAVRLSLVVAATTLCAGTGYAGESTGDEILEEVVVTGSAIRRIDGEASLPVQVLDSEAIARTGATSVVDLIQRLPAMQGATVEADALGAETFGFAGTSLHNIGEERTLVLLNGRRLALFGGQTLTGFAAAVDLNVLPLSAIERVEVLTEGASSLYGSDALAGVVNFITRKNVQGFNASLQYSGPKGGGQEKGASLTGGFGDLETDGWNFFASLAVDDRNELRSTDRSFASSAIVNFDYAGARWTSFGGSPYNVPANVVADGGVYAGQLVSLQYLEDGVCPEGSVQVDAACYFDYVRYIQIYPERERKTATGSLQVKVGESSTGYVDVLWSRASQVAKVSPVAGAVLIEAGSDLFNQYLAPVRDDNDDPVFIGDSVAYYRGLDLGLRTNDDQADFYNVSAGLQGDVAGWSYDFALGQSESNVKGDISGFPGALALDGLLTSGLIDPLVGPGQQSAEGQAALEAASYSGYWDGGVSRLQSAQVQASKPLFDLPNGKPFLLGAGLSYSREKFRSKPGDFAQANLDDPVAGTPAAGGPGTGDQRFGDAAAKIPYAADRNLFGVFVEATTQPLEWLELTGAVRYDDYSDVGNTTNFKGSFRIQPNEVLLLRGSYGTGFHAPTVPQLNASLQSYGVTESSYDCSPELLAIANSLGAICRPPQTQYDVFAGGNQSLIPEESENVSFGVVYQPTRALSLGADYWWVGIKHAFGQITEEEAFGNPDQYPGSWTTYRDIGTNTTYVAYNQTNINTGKEYYSGIDFNLQAHRDTRLGRLSSQLLATWMLKNKLQLAEGGPFYKNIGDYDGSIGEPTFRWNGRIINSLEQGAWIHSLIFNYRSGYTDIETAVDGIDEDGSFNGEIMDVRLHVDDHLTLDWQSQWQVSENLRAGIGVLNLLDKDPPLSLTQANFPFGYDARYYDPRGRTIYGRVSLKF